MEFAFTEQRQSCSEGGNVTRGVGESRLMTNYRLVWQ